MEPEVDTKDINAVCKEADRRYRSIYTDAQPAFMPWACGWFRFIFAGQYGDYQAIDVPYHDQEHTMQGLLCLARLLYARHRAGADPPVGRRTFELGVLAILLHDSGYLRHRGDTTGSGAKYTLHHVERSREFARAFMLEHDYSERDIEAVLNMIQCTATNTTLADIPFDTDEERVVGYCVATADLLGQMSASDYVDRLPQLYAEFQESYEYYGKPAERLNYESPHALVANTPGFWQSYVKPKLEDQCEGMYRYLNDPYPNGRNPYLACIQENIDKAARRAAGNTVRS